MRQSIALAYLLARAADSIADSDQLPNTQQERLLDELLLKLKDPSSTTDLELTASFGPTLSHAGEQKLLQQLPSIIEVFETLEENDKSSVLKVVTTLISGMKMDLETFASQDSIKALQTSAELETYIYLVAGCVGDFWTQMSTTHIRSLAHWPNTNQSQLGIEFGKALQLTNILRDVAKDAKLGRCYLPEEDLKLYSLTVEMLLNKQNDGLFRPIIFNHIKLSLKYFESAQNYLLNTPRTELRLRLASIWPILIGLKTLELIANKENFLDSEKTIKVPRSWVYSMLLRSLFIIGSNKLLSLWISRIQNNIQIKLS